MSEERWIHDPPIRDARTEPLIVRRRVACPHDGIVAHARLPLNTSVLEGVNNTIKVIQRVGYGFRNLDYFFLEIRAAFPGKAG